MMKARSMTMPCAAAVSASSDLLFQDTPVLRFRQKRREDKRRTRKAEKPKVFHSNRTNRNFSKSMRVLLVVYCALPEVIINQYFSCILTSQEGLPWLSKQTQIPLFLSCCPSPAKCYKSSYLLHIRH
jgi:hypothetical protein